MIPLADILHDVLGFSTVSIEEVVENVISEVGDISDSLEFLKRLREALPMDEDTAIHLVVQVQENQDDRQAKRRRKFQQGDMGNNNPFDIPNEQGGGGNEGVGADPSGGGSGTAGGSVPLPPPPPLGGPLTFAQASILAASERNSRYKDDPIYIERLRVESRREYLKEREKAQIDLAKRIVEDREEWSVDDDELKSRLKKINEIERKRLQLAEELQAQRASASRDAMTTYTMPSAESDQMRDKLRVLRAKIGATDQHPITSGAGSGVSDWENRKVQDALIPSTYQTGPGGRGGSRGELTSLIDDQGNEIVFEKAEVEKVGTAAEAQDEWWHMSLEEREELRRQEMMEKRERIKMSRQSLPVYKFRKQVLKAIRDNPVIILVGETGSGKTTQIPQFLNEVGYGDLGVIACSQPRRVAAMSVAVRVAEELGVKLGQEVGYIIRFESEVTGNDNIKGNLPTNVTLKRGGGDTARGGDTTHGGDTTSGGDPTARGGDPTARGGDPTTRGGDHTTRGGDPTASKVPSPVVGGTTRPDYYVDHRTRICYMTDGVLLNQFMIDPLLSNFSCVMIDEAHERSVNTDILFALVKDLSRYREDDLRVIISSATMEAEKLSLYFDNAPIFTIPGRKHHVEIMYTRQPEANFIHAAALTTVQIHLNEPLYDERLVDGELVKEHNGDILVFMPGHSEIEECMDMIYDLLREAQDGGVNSGGPPSGGPLGSGGGGGGPLGGGGIHQSTGRRLPELRVLPIYSSLPSDQQALIFKPTPFGTRKCIIATNIAETSITIDNIVYVVDPGLVKENQYDPRTGVQSLITVTCSRASCNQRAGRAGRVRAGKCYRLFTQISWQKELEENNTPEIMRCDLCQIVLLLKSLGIDDLIHFDFIDPPPTQAVVRSLETLYHLGALNDKGNLTAVGRSMALIPGSPFITRMILAAGQQYGCLEDCIIIAAMLEVGHGLFYIPPKDKQQIAEAARKEFLSNHGDQLTLLRVYRTWESLDYNQQWCQEHFIQFRHLAKARDIYDQFVALLPKVGIDFNADDTTNNTDTVLAIKKSIAQGFFMQSALLSKNGQYKTITDNQSVDIHPFSALFVSANNDPNNFERKLVRPNCVIFHELIQTAKKYMRNCLEIDKELLTQAAPHYFRTKKDFKDVMVLD